MDLSHEPALSANVIAEKLREHGYDAFFAGGCVRDFLMRREPHDIDIATSALPDDIERIFAKTLPVGKQFGVILVEEKGEYFEVATFRKEAGYADGRHPDSVEFTGPEEDAARRDFTVNGLFYDSSAGKVIDYVGGKKDIKHGIIRAIGSPVERFTEDKLRLLRAVRFASSLNFNIEEQTFEAVRALAPEIRCVSPERIREELVKMFTRSNPARGFELLSESGLMKVILPEIEAMKGVPQPREQHSEGDVFEHTRKLFEHLKEPSVTLAFSCLFHDVGKPPTFSESEGKITFRKHAAVGAEMTRAIMKRLRFSNDEVNRVADAVANHLKFSDVQNMREGKLKVFMMRESFPEELELYRLDCMASHGRLDNYDFLVRKRDEFKLDGEKQKPYLNGELLKSIGMKPGPAMKPLLEEAYMLQLEHEINSEEEAVSWAKSKLSGRNLS